MTERNKKPTRAGSTRVGLIFTISVVCFDLSIETDSKLVRDASPHCILTKQLSCESMLESGDIILRKEVIQPQVPLRLPCYDLVPITEFILGACLLAVSAATSDAPHFRGLTGGVYKAQEHIHRGMLTRDY